MMLSTGIRRMVCSSLRPHLPQTTLWKSPIGTRKITTTNLRPMPLPPIIAPLSKPIPFPQKKWFPLPIPPFRPIRPYSCLSCNQNSQNKEFIKLAGMERNEHPDMYQLSAKWKKEIQKNHGKIELNNDLFSKWSQDAFIGAIRGEDKLRELTIIGGCFSDCEKSDHLSTMVKHLQHTPLTHLSINALALKDEQLSKILGEIENFSFKHLREINISNNMFTESGFINALDTFFTTAPNLEAIWIDMELINNKVALYTRLIDVNTARGRFGWKPIKIVEELYGKMFVDEYFHQGRTT